MLLNDPALVATLAGLHDAYEAALAANDVAALNAFFWDSPHVVRFGVAEQLYGADSLHAYRQGHKPVFTARRLVRREISIFSADFATVMSEIELTIAGLPRASRQSQTWVRLPGAGWRIVAAHVSSPLSGTPAAPEAPSPATAASPWAAHVDALSRGLGLPVATAHRPGVIANLERAAAIAAPLLAFSLPDHAEPAPVFTA
jgi:hypothetical protein